MTGRHVEDLGEVGDGYAAATIYKMHFTYNAQRTFEEDRNGRGLSVIFEEGVALYAVTAGQRMRGTNALEKCMDYLVELNADNMKTNRRTLDYTEIEIGGEPALQTSFVMTNYEGKDFDMVITAVIYDGIFYYISFVYLPGMENAEVCRQEYEQFMESITWGS